MPKHLLNDAVLYKCELQEFKPYTAKTKTKEKKL
jgi:hypothetical protein